MQTYLSFQSSTIDINNILDFSSNINPFGASRKALGYVSENIDMVSIYPDPEYISLKKCNYQATANAKQRT